MISDWSRQHFLQVVSNAAFSIPRVVQGICIFTYPRSSNLHPKRQAFPVSLRGPHLPFHAAAQRGTQFSDSIGAANTDIKDLRARLVICLPCPASFILSADSHYFRPPLSRNPLEFFSLANNASLSGVVSFYDVGLLKPQGCPTWPWSLRRRMARSTLSRLVCLSTMSG